MKKMTVQVNFCLLLSGLQYGACKLALLTYLLISEEFIKDLDQSRHAVFMQMLFRIYNKFHNWLFYRSKFRFYSNTPIFATFLQFKADSLDIIHRTQFISKIHKFYINVTGPLYSFFVFEPLDASGRPVHHQLRPVLNMFCGL